MAKKGSFYLDKLYFFWGLKEHKDANIINSIPNFLPFELDYDKNLKLLTQKKKKVVLNELDRIYRLGSDIGNIQSANPWSKEYGEDFIDFIKTSIAKYNTDVESTLEIGCGECILLQALQKNGFNVIGVEPAPSVLAAGKKIGVKVICDFFPTSKLRGKSFDLIYHSGVLEHVNDPVSFLKQQHNQLKPNGILIISTPDYTESIVNGDISMLLHEHLSYFDEESLRQCVKKAGFKDIKIERAKFGGFLYCVAKKGSHTNNSHSFTKKASEDKYKQFLNNNQLVILRMEKYIKNILSDKNKTLGFYAPVRTLPYLAILDLYKGFRFFDDNPSWHKKYLKGIDVPIENLNDLKKNPVTNILIMSPTFGSAIEDKIKKNFKNKIKITRLKDFYI